MKYLIIGTAGHVDHGKSALIKALTGTETDRLKEEKERGISIDLGFALLPLAEDIMAGIVDVPGHERFLKNMLAGTGGMDLVMLVIAADEGVMPQTREHLAMLSLYGVKRGVIVINKIDKVDAEWLELVEAEVKELLAGTFLETAPSCRVSAFSGEGVEELKDVLLAQARLAGVRDSKAPFRLWIDRVFSIKGHGAVVTGSLLSGEATVGDLLRLDPVGAQVRVRGVEWHGKKVERVVAGQRAAINIVGVESEALARGMVLSAEHVGEVGAVWDVRLEWREEVDSGSRIRLHIGTGEYIGRLYRFKDRPAEVGRLVLEEEVAAAPGDRGIIRQYSPQYLLAGVTMLRPGARRTPPKESRVRLGEALTGKDEKEFLSALLADADEPLNKTEVLSLAGYRAPKPLLDALAALLEAEEITSLESGYVRAAWLNEKEEKLKAALEVFHAEEPERSGISKEALRQRLHLAEKTFECLVRRFVAAGWLKALGGDLALTEHAERHARWERELIAKAQEILEKIGLEDVQEDWLQKQLNIPEERRKVVWATLVRQGVLIRMGGIHVYSKTIQNIVTVIQEHFQRHATLSVSELRDLINTSRKYAMPILEYLDMNKYTKREGDTRTCGAKLKDLSE
ncbi:selenocysteine-specific translation elongation factor [Azotosporobacter soli]|uniref:selenocysteine-specific translation elongation factor n=1 Tax=Azotosporobacter soli TaxID=3055040 RepID=UPI0031FE8F6C